MRKSHNTKRKAVFASAAVASLFLAVLVGAGPAQASTGVDWSSLRSFLALNGATTQAQDRVIAKASAGDILDSMKASAISVASRVRSTTSTTEVVYTYADGSILVSSLEKGTPVGARAVAPLAITGCTVTSGTGFSTSSGCSVTQTNGMIEMTFKASYTKFTGGATINYANTARAAAKYGSVTQPTVAIVQKNAAGSAPAVATAHARFSSATQSEDLYLSLRVTSSLAWSTDY